MSARNRYNPDSTSHPGATMLELLESDGRSQVWLAKKLKLSTPYINDVVRGRRGVSAAFALKLEPVFHIAAEFWLRLQMNHDLAEARAIEKRRAKRKAGK